MYEGLDGRAVLAEGIDGFLPPLLADARTEADERRFLANLSLASRRRAMKRQAGGNEIAYRMVSGQMASRSQLVEWEAGGVDAVVLDVAGAFSDASISGEEFVRDLEEVPTMRQMLFILPSDGRLFARDALTFIKDAGNIVPLVRVDGMRQTTDRIQGVGAYSNATLAMECLGDCGILFGAVVTLAEDTLDEAVDENMVSELDGLGCEVVCYIERAASKLSAESWRTVRSRLELIRNRRKTPLIITWDAEDSLSR